MKGLKLASRIINFLKLITILSLLFHPIVWIWFGWYYEWRIFLTLIVIYLGLHISSEAVTNTIKSVMRRTEKEMEKERKLCEDKLNALKESVNKT